ncbi:hypothetical protein MSS93_00275 [Deinococcus radiodurans]|nr:hypothetical protein MSS93_00275 [Deinococcus radiodurans]
MGRAQGVQGAGVVLGGGAFEQVPGVVEPLLARLPPAGRGVPSSPMSSAPARSACASSKRASFCPASAARSK